MPLTSLGLGGLRIRFRGNTMSSQIPAWPLRSWDLGQHLNGYTPVSSFVNGETDTRWGGVGYSLLDSPTAQFLSGFITERQHLRVVESRDAQASLRRAGK